jgi:hypothetical protein
LNYGLKKCGVPAPGARLLRKELANWTVQNSALKISGTPVKEWIKWDSKGSVKQYARKMQSTGSWGGGIEMAAFSHKMKLDVHVYETMRGGKYKRISCFNVKGNKQTVHVLYAGRMHFDALVPGAGKSGSFDSTFASSSPPHQQHGFQQRSPFGQQRKQNQHSWKNKSQFQQKRNKKGGKKGGRGRW